MHYANSTERKSELLAAIEITEKKLAKLDTMVEVNLAIKRRAQKRAHTKKQ
jgi:hypothetical protein